MNKSGYFAGAIVGFIVGGAAVHFFEKKKNDAAMQIREQEIREHYMKQYQDGMLVTDQESDISVEEALAPEVEQEETEADQNYDNIVGSYTTMEPEVDQLVSRPYPINSNEFGETGYEKITFTYYADDVLVDESYKVISEADISDFVGGRTFAKMFGDYGEMGVIHIRNDSLSSDFEIVQDPRNWRDFKKSIPSFPTGRGPYDDYTD